MNRVGRHSARFGPVTSRGHRPPMSDVADDPHAALVARAALGDRQAFAQVYRLTSAQVLGVVLRILPERGVAEEVTQEVYVTLWQQAGHYDLQRASVMGWLVTMARHRAIDVYRRRQARPEVALTPHADDEEPPEHRVPDEAAGPLQLLEDASEKARIDCCMAQLSQAQRQSIALAYYQGQSQAEVAEQLRQPLGTVKSWIRRGLLLLRDCLGQAGAVRAANQR